MAAEIRQFERDILERFIFDGNKKHIFLQKF